MKACRLEVRNGFDQKGGVGGNAPGPACRMTILINVLGVVIPFFILCLLNSFPAHASQGFYSIHVNSFKSMANAEKAMSLFEGIDQEVYYQQEAVDGKAMWYRVYVGKYGSRKEADDAARTLKQRGLISYHRVEPYRKKIIDGDKAEKLSSPAKDMASTADKGGAVTEEDRPSPPTPEDHTGIFAPGKMAGKGILPPPEPIRLSLLDAMRYSLEGNQSKRIASYMPQQARENLASAESVYDPSLFAEGAYSRTVDIDPPIILNTIMEDETTARAGIRKPLVTGGNLSVLMETNYLDYSSYLRNRNMKYYKSAPVVELRQPLLKAFGGKAERASIDIENHNVNIADEAFRQTAIDVATQVSRVYWQLFMYRELVLIDRETLFMAEEIHRREIIRLAAGQSKKLDVERAHSVAEARRRDLLRSSERLRVVMDHLRVLINRPGLTIDSNAEIIPIENPQTVPVEVDETAAISKALEGRPELKRAKKALEIERIQEDLARHERLPELDVFGRYSMDGYGREFSDSVDNMGLDDRDSWAVGLNFNWPIGNRSAAALYRRQSLKRQAALVEVERVTDQVKLEVKRAIHAITLARDEIESTRRAAGAAEKVVKGEFARFDLGQMTNEELLRAQDFLATAKINNIQAVVNYNIALSELAQAQGVSPVDDVGAESKN